MELLKTKVWSWADIWLLKSCAFVFGIIAGAYLSDFVKQYVWVFVLAAVILTIRPAVKYFGNSK
jgi:hypothetical protein